MWGGLHSFNLEAQSAGSRMVPWLLIPRGRSGPLAYCFQNPHVFSAPSPMAGTELVPSK